jgi:predicted PurR-regulated permease PerM
LRRRANIITSLFIFLIGLFYLLKDGVRLKSLVMRLSPLSDRNETVLFAKLIVAINSVVKGALLIALIQGIAVTVGLLLFGVPNPFLWGSLAVVAALIPAVGTSLILIPAILYLFFSGQTLAGFGLAIWGLLGVGLIDNFFSPRILGKGMKMHPLITFLSTMGGLAYFGLPGFLLGPLFVSVLFALIEIYFSLAEKPAGSG